MKDIQLTECQQKEIIKAISWTTIGPVDEAFIVLARYDQLVVDTTLSRVVIDFYLMTRKNNQSFQVRIDYYNGQTKSNPESIALLSFPGDNSYVFLPLSRLGYVTDKLREYNVW
ncbi:hypothetical protein [Spirosoma aerophilum]